jgi:hypothetical protein
MDWTERRERFDADHGYGNALSVKRTVEELETAGVAGMTIEDTALPTGYGASGPTLIPTAEGVGKMKAALAGRQDKRLVIVGRTSAMAITGVEDTIARLKAYEQAGVDMLFMAAVKTRAQLDAVASAVKLPLYLGSPGAELYDLDYLSARNVRLPARSPAVHGRGECSLRNHEGAACRHAASQYKNCRISRSDETSDASGRLCAVVKGVSQRESGRRVTQSVGRA